MNSPTASLKMEISPKRDQRRVNGGVARRRWHCKQPAPTLSASSVADADPRRSGSRVCGAEEESGTPAAVWTSVECSRICALGAFSGQIVSLVQYTAERSASTRSAAARFAPRRFAPVRFVQESRAPFRFAHARSAICSDACSRFAPVRHAYIRSAFVRFTRLRSARLRSVSCRSAFVRSAPARTATLRSASYRLAPPQIRAGEIDHRFPTLLAAAPPSAR